MSSTQSNPGGSIRGVILDIDGTLVDSNNAHAHAWFEALLQTGHAVSFDKVRRLIGMGGDHLLPNAIGIASESRDGKNISARRKEIFCSKYLPEVRAFSKASDLLKRMRERGMQLVVASSAEADELHQLLKLCGADQLSAEVTSSDDVANSKPDSDVVRVSLKKLSLPAIETVMLGDTPYDVEAATKAGVPVVALRCGGWRDSDLQGSIAIYDDPADLLEQFETSPFAAQPVARNGERR